MPSLGEGVDEGRLVTWLVRPDDLVRQGDVVAVVETEKATVEVEASATGLVRELIVPEGGEVLAGAVLATLATDEAEAGRRRAGGRDAGSGPESDPGDDSPEDPPEGVDEIAAVAQETEAAERLIQAVNSLRRGRLLGEDRQRPDHEALPRYIQTARERLRAIQNHLHEALEKTEEPLARALEELRETLDALHATEAELSAKRLEVRQLHRLQEQALARYRELFELMPAGYLVTGPDGSIREANRAARELLGRESLAGAKLRDFVAEAGRAAFEAREADLLEGRLPHARAWQLAFEPRPGEGFEAELTAEPTGNLATVRGLRWLLRDVSERRLLKE